MKIGFPKEKDDKRVGMVPEMLKKLTALGVEVLIESGAGISAGYSDADYGEGAAIVGREELLKTSDMVISINPLDIAEYKTMKDGAYVISMFKPYFDDTIIEKLKTAGVKAFSMDMIPRTTLAQAMDVLSSMASVAGYKAVLVAANHLTRYFPMMITAAGSIKPSKVLVLGAGVAGLQAIATAKRLGAMVEAFDTRSAAKEEVESLGAKFVEVEGATEDTGAGGYAVEQSEDFIKRQRQEVQNRAMKADVIITTAQVRGRKAPVLVPDSTVQSMKKGSVIVDLASSTGGNVEGSKDREVVVRHGVTIIGNSDLAAEMPQDSSFLFANNVWHYLKTMVKDGELSLDMDNEILDGSFITK